MVAMPCSAVASTRIETSPIRKSIGRTRFDLARLKKGQAIRSCASRAAMSPPALTNRSSCAGSAGKVDRRRMGSASAPHRRRIAVEPLGGMDHALAGIAGRTAQAEFGPGVEVGQSSRRSVRRACGRPGRSRSSGASRACGRRARHARRHRASARNGRSTGVGLASMARLRCEGWQRRGCRWFAAAMAKRQAGRE
jgi:hypothetical protein